MKLFIAHCHVCGMGVTDVNQAKSEAWAMLHGSKYHHKVQLIEATLEVQRGAMEVLGADLHR